MAREEATADRGAQTMGTNPWGATAGPLPPALAALRDEVAAFAPLIDRLVARADELPRLREVVRRLEQRVVALERALTEERRRNRDAAQQLDDLIEDLQAWKPSVPSPSTFAGSG